MTLSRRYLLNSPTRERVVVTRKVAAVLAGALAILGFCALAVVLWSSVSAEVPVWAMAVVMWALPWAFVLLVLIIGLSVLLRWPGKPEESGKPGH